MELARGCFSLTTGATKRGVAIKGGCYNGESCSRNILGEQQAKPRHLYTPTNYALYERTEFLMPVTTEAVHSISEIPLRMETAGSYEVLAPIYQTNRVTSKKTIFFILNDVKTPVLTSADINPTAPTVFVFLDISCRKW